MAKEIIVNVGHRETRIAVLDEKLLVELHVEREQRVVGNLYKAKVDNVLQGMDAAFVEIGLERNAFLYVADILPEDDEEGGGRFRGRDRRDLHIKDLVQRGDQLLVQVVKGPRGTKGSRVSTRVSLPGRFLVLMPEANNLGVSRKIDESKERDRLKKIVQSFREPGFGVIVRTEAEGRGAAELRQDYLMLTETWREVQAKSKSTQAPALIHQDMGLVYKILRDAFGSDIGRLVIDSPTDYAQAHEIISRISPDLQDRIELYDGEKPIFEFFKIEDDIERLLRRKVPLKSGGSLIIDQTEALVSIDVNSGKFTGTTGLADTILKTNLEATEEIARQLRLRDLGGMIILDFIDMDSPRDKKTVMDAFVKALKDDRSRTKISSISALGLIEMTRKRTGETVDTAMTEICPYCHGLGRVDSAETVSLSVERELRRLAATTQSEAFVVTTHPDVAAHLVGAQGEDLEMLERQLRRSIYVRSGPSWHHVEKYDIDQTSIQKVEQTLAVPRRGQTVECVVSRDDPHGERAPWAISYLLPQRAFQVDLANGAKYAGQTVRVRLTDVRRSIAIGEVVGGASKGGGNRENGSGGERTGGGERHQPRERTPSN
ncbi:MAG: Rne/Rng family ribonuclease [Capsulimonas sp.]|uniref:Rne/Rng family ribonuclease n=1 Tax=Capsulimonas sp. TaxID=2494211 RepID=UPI003265F407